MIEHPEENFDQIRLQHCLHVLVVHQQIPQRSSQRANALQCEEIWRGVVFAQIRVDGFQHEGVLREEEGSLGVYAEEQQGVYRVDDLIADVALETHY